MKTVFNFGFAVALGAAILAPATAESQIFHSVRELLSSHFADSEHVRFERVRPSGHTERRIERRLGDTLPKDEYIFYVAETDGAPDGYALFDQELGQHEPIDFATFFDARGNVTRVEVVAYREPYGEGIRSKRFRRQFVGRDASDDFQPGHDIDVISGATISTRSMCRAVERATVLLEETLLARDAPLASR